MKIILAVSIAINLWFAAHIVRLEKFHASTMTGSCSEVSLSKEGKLVWVYDQRTMYQCLSQQQPRTSELWNLVYGLNLL